MKNLLFFATFILFIVASSLKAEEKFLSKDIRTVGKNDEIYHYLAPNIIEDEPSKTEKKSELTLLSGTEEDNRWQVPPRFIELLPFRAIGRLEIRWENFDFGYCSGTLISHNVVLTAAHCVYNSQKGHINPSSSFFVPGYHNDIKPFGAVGIIDFKVPEGRYNPRESYKYDYALLKVDYEIGNDTGWLNLKYLDDNEYINRLVNATGYPADKGLETMWSGADKILDVTENDLYFKTTVTDGMSGGPVWQIWPDEYNLSTAYLIGVISVSSPGEYSLGNRTNQAMIEFIETSLDEWGKEL